MDLMKTHHRPPKRHHWHTWTRSSRSKVRSAYELRSSLVLHSNPLVEIFAFPPKKKERGTAALSGRLGHPADQNDLGVLPSLDALQMVTRPGPRSAVHLRLTEVLFGADIRGCGHWADARLGDRTEYSVRSGRRGCFGLLIPHS